nr:zinc finger, CCHC-type [Tanacetum cinerariifolium]
MQKKMHFLLTTFEVVYVLTTLMPEFMKDDTIEAISHLRIDESLKAHESDKGKGKEVARPYVNITEKGKNKNNKQNKGKKRAFNENNGCFGSNKKPKLKCWKCGKTGHFKGIVVVIDSGATTHVCKDRCWFKTYEPVEDGYVLYMGGDHLALVYGKGSVVLEFSLGKSMTLFNVLYVPKLRKNLIFGPVLNKCVYKQVYESDKYILSKSGVFVGFGYYNNGCRAVVRLLDLKRKTLGEKEETTKSIIAKLVVAATSYFIWQERNNRMFKKSKRSLNQVADCIINSMRLKLKSCRWKKSKDALDVAKLWNLEKEVYMKQPEGFVMPCNEHKVCKLVKSLYGLKQAPKQWHQKFNEVVLSSGFLLNQSDKYVYNKFDDSGKGVIISLYVDDMLIYGTDQNQVNKTKKFLSSRFSKKDMGEADAILGIKIKRENKGIVITQSHYIERILKKFNREDCSPVSTLMDPVEKLKPNTGKHVDRLEYSRAIVCFMYAMTSTRLDIAYAVGKLSMFTSNLSRQHWHAITRVLKYLKGTMNYGLSYVRYPLVLEAYSYASWINHVEDSSSTSGWVFLLGGGVIS